ncbi:hypothetical protein N9M97_03700 [Planktomarina temperata]|nr:hypothetical protein [Planktomarina temperata]
MRFLQSLEKNYRRLRDDYRRRAQNEILKQRWAGKSDRPPVAQANGPSGLDRFEIHYINLKHSEDRRAEIQSEFKALGVTRFARFEAIADANGALGCAKSHETVLSSASILEDQLLMICEDDCQFIADRAAIDAAIEEFFFNPHLDVLCLAYNAENGFAISQNLMITSDTQTMSCYILKAPAIAPVLDTVRFSVDNLSRGGRDMTMRLTGFGSDCSGRCFRPLKRSFRPAAAVFFRHRKKSSRLWVITRRPKCWGRIINPL